MVSPDVMKTKILDAAVTIAERDGYANIRKRTVAEQAACTGGLVLYHFGTMEALRLAVLRVAIAREILPIIAAAVITEDAQNVPDDLRRRALAGLLES